MRVPVICISCCKAEIQYFTPVIYSKVQFKTIKPPCGTFTPPGNAFKYFMLLYPVVVTDINCCGIYKTYSSTFPIT